MVAYSSERKDTEKKRLVFWKKNFNFPISKGIAKHKINSIWINWIYFLVIFTLLLFYCGVCLSFKMEMNRTWEKIKSRKIKFEREQILKLFPKKTARPI